MNSLELVREFHRAIGHPIGDLASPDVTSRTRLRLDLIAEEFKELCEACGYKLVFEIQLTAINGKDEDASFKYADPVKAADSLADIKYVVDGAAVEWGIPLDEVFQEVHRSNMDKKGGPVREDGKQLKPEGWRGPDIAGILERYRNA